MPTISYEFRPNFRVPVKAAVVGTRIEALKLRNANAEFPEGFVDPEEIVDDARPSDSPLHGCFTWDDGIAAEKWRHEEARYLQRCYAKIIRDESETIVISPANVRVLNEDRESVFVTPSFAMSNGNYRQQVLDEATALLDGVQERLRNLQGISPAIIEAIDKIKAMIEREATLEEAKKTKKTKKVERKPVGAH